MCNFLDSSILLKFKIQNSCLKTATKVPLDLSLKAEVDLNNQDETFEILWFDFDFNML